jgi:hypothetical protein
MDTSHASTAQLASSSCRKDYSMAEFFATIDTAIMGRKTVDAGLKMSGGSPRYHMTM